MACQPCRHVAAGAQGPTVPDCTPTSPTEARRIGTIHGPHTVYAYLGPKAWRLKKERAWLLALTPEYLLANEGVIGEGSETSVEVDLDWALSCVRRGTAPFCVLAHNHPSGRAWPSQEDARLTRAMQAAAARQRCTLLDHVVIGRNEYFSFTEGQLWQVTKTT